MKNEYSLITMVVVGFNQEVFIHEAIQSAFNQDYPNLEIILSDDCSTDHTFKIMEDMASTYSGMHRVVARKNICNVGTALHLQFCYEVSNGCLLVFQAGDDLSTHDRVSKLVRKWQEKGCPEGAVHSGRYIFENSSENVIGTKKATVIGDGDVLANWKKWLNKELPACPTTCAFTRGVFCKFQPLFGGSVIDDGPLQFRAALIGVFIRVDEPLIYQRVGIESAGTNMSILSIPRWNRLMQSRIIACRTSQSDLKIHSENIFVPDLKKIEKNLLSYAKSCALLLLPERDVGFLDKIYFSLNVLFRSPKSRSFFNRASFLIVFFRFEKVIRFAKYIKNIVKHR